MPLRKPPTPANAGPGVTSMGQRCTYVCAKCQKTFSWYKGVKVVVTGIALCEEHNPALKRDAKALESDHGR